MTGQAGEENARDVEVRRTAEKDDEQFLTPAADPRLHDDDDGREEQQPAGDQRRPGDATR